MCDFISFFHNPFTKELALYDLTSHGKTKKALKLSNKCWREAHYLPTRGVDLRFAPSDNFNIDEYVSRFKSEYPTFAEFFNYAFEKTGQTKTYKGSLLLSSLKSIPEGLKFPESIWGSVNLSSLKSIPEDFKFPESIGGWLDLESLTEIPEGLKLPESIGDWFDLRGLTSIPEGLKLPRRIDGWLYLNNLEIKDRERIKEKYPNITIY